MHRSITVKQQGSTVKLVARSTLLLLPVQPQQEERRQVRWLMPDRSFFPVRSRMIERQTKLWSLSCTHAVQVKLWVDYIAYGGLTSVHKSPISVMQASMAVPAVIMHGVNACEVRLSI